MNKPKDENLRGVINPSAAQKHFSLDRFYPSEYLQHIVEHYWLINWQLPNGVEHKQYVASHPAINMTFLQNNSTVTGIVTQRFQHTLSGQGCLVGVRFTPAGFYHFAQQMGIEMTAMTNNSFTIEQFFSVNVKILESEILALDIATDKTQMLETSLFQQIPETNAEIAKVNDMVKHVETNKLIVKVADICQKFQLTERQLQRLFNKYIGIGPKWIINRYRIHQALEQIETTTQINWAEMAIDLGYYDQAHFIKDFKNLIGITPDKYFKNQN